MKRYLKLVPAIVMLFISVIMLSTVTFAWFSMNTTVTATNMAVKATTGSSLVISTNTNFTAGTVEVSKSGVNVTLMPATPYVSGMLDATVSHTALTTPATGLVYVANTGDVDPSTGLARAGKTLYYAPATIEAVDSVSPGHYFDYDFYIAAEGNNAIEAGTLAISIDAVDFSGFVPSEKILQAVTVQPYVNDVLTGSPICIKDGVTDQVLISDLSVTNIPAGAPGEVTNAIKITLRVYLDGALLESEGITYVKNASIVDLTRYASFSARFGVVTD